jgi:hypothetical protein
MTMTELRAARVKAHRANLERYCRLLTTELTETERTFVHRRIAEERLALEELHQGSGFSGEVEEAQQRTDHVRGKQASAMA